MTRPDRSRTRAERRLLLLGSALLLSISSLAGAVPTRLHRVTSYPEFEAGEPKGMIISSLGELHAGYATERRDVVAAFVRCSVEGPGGIVYLGTGVQGELWAYEQGKTRKVVRIPDVVEIASLAVGADGTVFVGSTPGGRIHAVKNGQVKELAKLDADHIWALEWDGSKKTLYAATGSQGKLFAIDPVTGKNRVVWSSGQKHLRTLVRDGDDAFWIGTGDEAILFHVKSDGTMRAVHDFEGEEIRAMVSKDRVLFLAVNQFERGGGGAPPPPPRPMAIPGPPIAVPTPAPPGGGQKGRGAIFRIDPEGRVELLHAIGDGYFTALAVQPDGSLLAATSGNGRVFLVRPDRIVFTAFDFPERQVLTLLWNERLQLLGTGDAGGLYRVVGSGPKDAVYTSKVFDSEFPSKFGNLRWHGVGDARFETRSGNTAKPDKSWSDWMRPSKVTKLSDGGVARVASPTGRYVQFRVLVGGAVTLRDVQLYYIPQNQRARVTDIQIGEEAPKPGPPAPGAAAPSRTRSPLLKLRWKVENPDGDMLVYRLWFREEGEANWKPLGGTNYEPLTRNEHDWNTEAVPDGNYVVRVVASDERANPRDVAMEHALTSQSFLVDNRKPEVMGLEVKGQTVVGRAVDSFSPIQELAFSIDGGEWQILSAADGILDDLTESFTIRIPQNLEIGLHTIAVRAADAAGNLGASQIPFRVKAVSK